MAAFKLSSTLPMPMDIIQRSVTRVKLYSQRQRWLLSNNHRRLRMPPSLCALQFRGAVWSSIRMKTKNRWWKFQHRDLITQPQPFLINRRPCNITIMDSSLAYRSPMALLRLWDKFSRIHPRPPAVMPAASSTRPMKTLSMLNRQAHNIMKNKMLTTALRNQRKNKIRT